ncbi:MAG: hypothetical protein D6B26_02940, partial [Spirochaetaceae bacterium]
MKKLILLYQNYFRLFNRQRDYPDTYKEELNYQASRIILLCGIIILVAWLPYLAYDSAIHPEITALPGLRLGLTVTGAITVILALIPAIRHRYALIILIFLGAYLEIATGVITGMTMCDPVYIGGFLFILMLIPLVPFPRIVSWSLMICAVGAFFLTGTLRGMVFTTTSQRYSLNDVLTTAVVGSIFIYITDKIRYKNWSSAVKVQTQNTSIENANRNIINSITYTKRIQESFLPSCTRLKSFFNDFMVLWQPRDIVGGDIYYVASSGGKTYLCLFDCTGHGVPGAFLTTVTLGILERILIERPGIDPASALARLNSSLQYRLHEEVQAGKSSDGADGVLLCFDPHYPDS